MRWSRFSPRFYVAAAIFTLVALFGFIGPFIFSHKKMNHVSGGLYDHPTAKAWLGTDNFGYDVFTNLMYGTRTSLEVGLLAGVTAMILGVVIGTLAGYMGGIIDEVLMGITNVMLAIPQFVVLILISIALHKRSAMTVAMAIAVTSWPWLARAVRAQSSSVRTREHLDIARLSGVGTISVMVYDVIPYMLSYIVMAFVLQVAGGIQNEAALSLLGLGPTNTVSLGVMLNWALIWESIRSGAWWAFVPPTILLTLIVFSLLMANSSLDEVFNPRLQRNVIRTTRRARKALAEIAVPGTPVVVPADIPSLGPAGSAHGSAGSAPGSGGSALDPGGSTLGSGSGALGSGSTGGSR
jgi:peptide/nickel transport system permease protein